jgi:hypothetical protein
MQWIKLGATVFLALLAVIAVVFVSLSAMDFMDRRSAQHNERPAVSGKTFRGGE